ncbi:thiamine-phosphate kinase [Halovenus salina]|uniref:thiamine-phosphate kinase n=1 Tax=Halovenus salina TaxID=1510225 RepID=UPI002260D014|nr:thiamine-phosphate kinase [Halovenus salina]
MDELEALGRLAEIVPAGGDDAAAVNGLVITTDMLHEQTDFPTGTTQYTAGWRAVGASLSDLAAMGADPVAAVAAYGAPTFEWESVGDFVDGAQSVCSLAGGEYVGGDLDSHGEFTVATTAVGRAENPVPRTGASPGDAVCVTGTLGRSAVALELFERGDSERANEVFRFEPRTTAGARLREKATAMMDSSDGLARSLHQLAAASDCGFALESPLPFDEHLDEIIDGPEQRREYGLFFGEDFELVCTLPEAAVADRSAALAVPLTRIGTVTEGGVTLDGEPLENRGYSH